MIVELGNGWIYRDKDDRGMVIRPILEHVGKDFTRVYELTPDGHVHHADALTALCLNSQ